MLEQTYFPLGGGPNWGKILIISIALISVGVIAYKKFVPAKIPTIQEFDKDENNDKEIIK